VEANAATRALASRAAPEAKRLAPLPEVALHAQDAYQPSPEHRAIFSHMRSSGFSGLETEPAETAISAGGESQRQPSAP
jgi:hypothetical protein